MKNAAIVTESHAGRFGGSYSFLVMNGHDYKVNVDWYGYGHGTVGVDKFWQANVYSIHTNKRSGKRHQEKLRVDGPTAIKLIARTLFPEG